MVDPEQVLELFAAASELPTADRAEFLAEECAGRPDLLARLESLLASHARAEDAGFLRRAALSEVASEIAAEAAFDRRAGEVLGRYRIVRLLGEGGMGEVYLAEDTELGRQVALKLIKSPLRTGELLERFGREGQILAHLNHESIARLLDAGTSSSGIPFLVMEYVDGKPITEHCDHNGLPVTARLELFRMVCAAVQYAHQNVVVHRDLKPGNILVTGDGQVKLLDFGVAKLLDSPETPATVSPALTPEYASPEQVKGEVTTTATDIYSLGVVLHEMLTGSRLYALKRRTAEEMLRAICEKEPRLPSTASDTGASLPRVAEIEGGAEKLRRRLRGDLDHIVLKALRKEPGARYATVEQFSADIARHLEGLPVLARRRTFGYRAAKFVRRNRAGVLAAAVVLLTVLAGIAATAWEARVAFIERAAALKRFNEVRTLAHTVLFDYHDAIAALPGSTPVRKRLVSDALVYLNRMSRDAVGDVALELEIASAYLRVGDVQGRPYIPNLGQTEPALESYRKALEILQPVAAKDPGNRPARRQLANAYERVGAIDLREFRFPEAMARQRQALEIRDRLAALDAGDAGLRREIGVSHLYLGDALQASCFGGPGVADCLRQALAEQRRAIEIFQKLASEHPADAQLRRDSAEAFMKIGFRLRDLATNGDLQSTLLQALESERQAMQIREELAAANPANARDRRSLADQRMLLSNAQAALGEVAPAIAGYRQSLATFQALAEADPMNAEARRDLSFVSLKLGLALFHSGKTAAALESYRASLAWVKQLLAEDPVNAEDRQQLAAAYFDISDALEAAADLPGAIDAYNRYLDSGGRNGLTLSRLAHLNMRAAQSKRTGDRRKYWEEARDALRQGLDLIRAHGGVNSKDANEASYFTVYTRELAECDAALAQLAFAARHLP